MTIGSLPLMLLGWQTKPRSGKVSAKGRGAEVTSVASKDPRSYGLASQPCQFLIWQGIHDHRFVERSVMPPKMWVQGQFHRCLGGRVAAQRIHHIHQHVGSFIVVKVLVHFVTELFQLVCFHRH
jgi:hypothetical protein